MIESIGNKRSLKHSIDWVVIGIYLALVFIGWINIYASIHSTEPPSIFYWGARSGKQFVWMLTSFGLAAIILFLIPPRWWEGLSVPLYLLVLGLLVLVIFVSKDVKGSHSWFELGPVKFQPAEISKITTSLLLATVLSMQGFKMTRIKDFLKAAALIAVPMLVIIAESETGSALVYAGFIFVLYREGLSGWWLGAVGLVIALFVFTLSSGAYTSFLILAGVLYLCYVLAGEVKKPGRMLLAGIAGMVFLIFVPDILGWVSSLAQARMEWMRNVVWVPQAGETQDLSWGFVTEITPESVFLVLTAIALPVLGTYTLRKRDFFLAALIGVLLLGVGLVFSTDYIFDNVLQPHQRGRIEVLLGIKEDLAGVGYNVNQSKIAIGSGGLLGKGFLQGTQTTYGFVPEQSTDFIFCTIGEEWGFVGCLIVILLYAFLIVRIILDAEDCRSAFTRVYGYCVAACIFMHLFINIGMTVGLMPVIGIPLPLLSYGGSSLWAFTILIFIFLALYRDEKKYF